MLQSLLRPISQSFAAVGIPLSFCNSNAKIDDKNKQVNEIAKKALENCTECMEPGATKRCKCQRVYYCNERCQGRHFPWHKRVCQYLKEQRAAKQKKEDNEVTTDSKENGKSSSPEKPKIDQTIVVASSPASLTMIDSEKGKTVKLKNENNEAVDSKENEKSGAEEKPKNGKLIAAPSLADPPISVSSVSVKDNMLSLELEALEEHLINQKYEAKIIPGKQEVVIHIKVDKVDCPFFFKIGNNTLQFLFILPYQVQPNAFNSLALLLHRLNNMIELAGFGLDDENKITFYRVSVLTDGKINRDIFNRIFIQIREVTLFFEPEISKVSGGASIESIVPTLREKLLSHGKAVKKEKS